MHIDAVRGAISRPVASPGATAGTSTTASAIPTAAIPGSIVVLACGALQPGSLCFGQQGGTIESATTKASNIRLSMQVTNPGGTASSPVAVLLYLLDAGTLPFGQPSCTTCSSTSSKSVIGLEWPALAPGETRALSVDVPVTGGPGNTAFFADLYARPLADVMTDEIASGVTPGQQSWKVALTISAP